MIISLLRTLSVTLATTIMMLGFTQAYAASQCKGLDNSACGQNASCGWVNGYERKDGRKVKAFCRTNAKPKSSTASAKSIEK